MGMVDQETWLNKFANLWLACEKNQDIIHSQDPIEKKFGRLIKEELTANISIERVQEQEEWLERFANLWLACEKNRGVLFNKQTEETQLEEKGPADEGEAEMPSLVVSNRHHAEDVLGLLEKGKVVIADSSLLPRDVDDSSMGIEESDLNPNDLIVFDIDPEMAIKLFTASKGVGL
jgi:hypothetical protein